MRDYPGRPSRRGFLKATAAGTALIALSTGVQAQVSPALPGLAETPTQFFTAAEWAFVIAACARLIPSDGDGPGATEARVPVFIDRQLAGDFGRAATWYMQGPFQPDADPLLGYQSPLTPAEIYRQAIPVYQDWCHRTHGASFQDLDAATQDAALTSLQQGQVGLAPELRDFFTLLLQNTKEGYFADPIYGGNHGMLAWSYVGFPGARGAYAEWVTRQNVAYPLGPVSISGERG